MAGRNATLTVRVLGDTAQAAGSFDQLSGKVDSFADGIGKKLLAAFSVAAVVGFVRASVQEASRLEQAWGGVDAVFGASADTVKAWSKDTTDSIRLGAASFSELATKIGGTLKNAGVPMDQLADKTRDTMQLGADLAARWGTSTEEAVNAISAALSRGEFDPIEKYNVSLTAAAVNSEKLRLASGEMAGATEAQLTAQARLNLIMLQSGDAIGAAAAEANTFAGRQEALREKTDNLKAAVGGPLLAAFGGFADLLGRVMDISAPVLITISELVASVAGLPGPVLLAGAAFAGWLVFGSRITGMFTDIATGMRGFQDRMAVQSALAAANGQSLSTMGSAAAAAQAQFGGLLSVLKQTAVFSAITAVIYAVSNAIGDWQAAQKRGEDSAKNVYKVLVEQKGAWNDVTNAALLAAAQESNAFSELTSLGLSSEEAIRGLTGSWEDWEAVRKRMQGLGMVGLHEIEAEVHAFREARDEADKLAKKTLEVDAAAAGISVDQLRAMKEEENAAKVAAEELEKAIKGAQDALGKTAASGFLTEIKSEADLAARQIEVLSGLLDQLAGRNRGGENAAAGWAKGLRELSEAGRDSEGAMAVSADAIARWDVAALNSTKAGEEVFGALNNLRDAYTANVQAAYQAAGGAQAGAVAQNAAYEAARQSYSAFIQNAQAMGLSGEQAQQLATKLGILDSQQISPKVLQILAEDEVAFRRLAELQATQVGAKNFDVIAHTDAATGEVRKLITFTNAQGGTVNVDAATGAAVADVNQWKGQTNSTTATAQVQANTNPAAQSAQSFVSSTAGRRDAVFSVSANITSAFNSVTSVLNFTRNQTATITVTANTGPAQAAINAIQGKSVNVTVVQSTVPGRSAAGRAEAPMITPRIGTSAPVTYATGAGSVGGGATYNVTVQGALVDPEGAARAIREVLRRSEHRRGAITVGV